MRKRCGVTVLTALVATLAGLAFSVDALVIPVRAEPGSPAVAYAYDGAISPDVHSRSLARVLQVAKSAPEAQPRSLAHVYDLALRLERTSAGPGAAFLAPRAADDLAEMSGILRDATRGKGNFGLGSATAAQADDLGQAWVGPGYRVASDGKTLISVDRLRQYRPPSYKPNLGRTQANFETRYGPEGQWQAKGHLDVTP